MRVSCAFLCAVSFLALTTICSVRVRELNLVVDVIYTAPAYLDEEFAISVSVVNNDALEIDTVLDILLQPGADDSRTLLLFYYLVWC